jgi:lipoprotein NlpI
MSRFRVPRSRFRVPGSGFRVPRSRFRVVRCWFYVLWFACASVSSQSAQALLNRGVSEFEEGRFAASAATFDELAKVIPDRAPDLWQRGIALYYAGRYADCRRQFESHRTVNPDDVENAVWHFLCVAREQSPTAARAALLPVGPDTRVPMRQVYDMFRGATTPDAVMKAAGSEADGQFYGNLYVGLYLEATGQRSQALPHIKAAAEDRYAAVGGYMHMVARVHLRTFRN